MIAVQLLAWAWFTAKGGKMTDRQFLVFTVCMLLGQLASCIETYPMAAWKSFSAQAYFLAWTTFGGVQRIRQMRQQMKEEDKTHAPTTPLKG
jgi:hypothetical protein